MTTTTREPVYWLHVYSGGLTTRRRCPHCKRRLFYDGSIRFPNGQQLHKFICDCQDPTEGRIEYVEIAEGPRWNPFEEGAHDIALNGRKDTNND